MEPLWFDLSLIWHHITIYGKLTLHFIVKKKRKKIICTGLQETFKEMILSNILWRTLDVNLPMYLVEVSLKSLDINELKQLEKYPIYGGR